MPDTGRPSGYLPDTVRSPRRGPEKPCRRARVRPVRRVDLAGVQGAAVQAAQQIAGERLGGGGLVHHAAALAVAGVGGQPRGGRLEALAVEREHGGVAGGDVAGVHVPALVVGAGQGAAGEAVVQPPGVVDLLGGADGQHVGGAVGDADAGAGGGDLHDGLGVVGGRVVAGLVGGADAAGRRCSRRCRSAGRWRGPRRRGSCGRRRRCRRRPGSTGWSRSGSRSRCARAPGRGPSRTPPAAAPSR